MRPWQFSRPKGPGFGLSKSYFLTVLASASTLPTPRQVANPKGADGAISGFCVPLKSDDKHALDEPMERGAYTLASRDQKTVLRLLVVSKEEAGFDPETFAQSPLALGVAPEPLARIRGTWNLVQLLIESHDATVYPALDFILGAASRLATLSDGVVGDSISRRYLMPQFVFSPRRTLVELPVYAEEHVTINFKQRSDGIYAYTLGLQKFALPEYEIAGLLDGDERSAAAGLLWLSQQHLLGTKIDEGYQVGAPGTMFEVRSGGFDRAFWGELPVRELVPPTSVDSTDAIAAWDRQIAAG
jgi:hypothetical protein